MFILKKVFSRYKEAYSGLPKEAWLLSLVEFINRTGTMVLFFMTLYLTREKFNFSTTQAGQVISGYGVGALLGAYFGGKLTDVLGAYNVQKISLILTGAGFILLGQMRSYWLIWGMMFFVGMASEALHPANSTAISQVCSPELRTRGFALNRLATNVGVTIGPAVGGYLALIDYSLLFWIDGITCFAAAVVFMLFFKTARPPQEPRAAAAPTPRSVWKDSYFLRVLVLIFFLAIIFVQLFNTFPLFFRTVYGFKENRIGLLIAINTIVIVLFEMVLMDALKTKKLAKVIAVGALLFGTGFALMPLGRGFIFAAFTVVVWTMGEILSVPSLSTLVANHSDDSVRGKYMGLLSSSFALAVAVGPWIGARIYAFYGPDALWFGCGGMGILLFLCFTHLKNTRDSQD